MTSTWSLLSRSSDINWVIDDTVHLLLSYVQNKDTDWVFLLDLSLRLCAYAPSGSLISVLCRQYRCVIADQLDQQFQFYVRRLRLSNRRWTQRNVPFDGPRLSTVRICYLAALILDKKDGNTRGYCASCNFSRCSESVKPADAFGWNVILFGRTFPSGLLVSWFHVVYRGASIDTN